VAFDVRRSELRQHFVVKTDDRSRVTQDRLALRGQKQPAALVDENRFSGELFQPLQLKSNRRLGTTKPPRGLGDAAGFDDRHQRAQHADIQIDQVHGVARYVQAGNSMQFSCLDASRAPVPIKEARRLRPDRRDESSRFSIS
jgi:hypothetical protein